MAERINRNLREIKFGGEGKSLAIGLGLGMTTLRNPRPEYNFAQGEVIEAVCLDDQAKVSIVVIANEIKFLNRQSIPVLALDGYFSADQAARDLKSFKGYEKTTKKSPMQAIVFISAEKFNSLPHNQQYDLTHEPIQDLLKDRNLRHLFFPTICMHSINWGGIKEWVYFLSSNNLISDDEKKKMENYKVNGRNVYQLLSDHPDIFRKLPLDRTPSFYRPLILGLFD